MRPVHFQCTALNSDISEILHELQENVEIYPELHSHFPLTFMSSVHIPCIHARLIQHAKDGLLHSNSFAMTVVVAVNYL